MDKLPALIEEEFRKEKKDFTIRDFPKEFELTGINVLSVDEAVTSWEFDYITTHDLDGWVTIQFIDWEAKRASMGIILAYEGPRQLHPHQNKFSWNC